MGRATTREELDAALAEARAEWGELQSVPRFAESMRAMREGALAKLAPGGS